MAEIDYKHPLVLKVKAIYNEGYAANEDAETALDKYNGATRQDTLGYVKKKLEIAEARLRKAKEEIPKLAKKMRNAEDLPQEHREYYADFMLWHLDNINRWHEAVKQRLKKEKRPK